MPIVTTTAACIAFQAVVGIVMEGTLVTLARTIRGKRLAIVATVGVHPATTGLPTVAVERCARHPLRSSRRPHAGDIPLRQLIRRNAQAALPANWTLDHGTPSQDVLGTTSI
jgi:hypothetical protein